jgi:hypothetical protein
MKQTKRKYFNITGRICTLLASTLVIAACGSDGGGGEDVQVADKGKGPQLSIDVEAFCGDPMAMEYEMYGEVMNTITENVAVRLTDVSDDNGPEGAIVGNLTIVCTAAVKAGRGKPNDVTFTTISIDDPGFGVINASCPLDALPDGATEWKATATATGGDVRLDVGDTCMETEIN